MRRRTNPERPEGRSSQKLSRDSGHTTLTDLERENDVEERGAAARQDRDAGGDDGGNVGAARDGDADLEEDRNEHLQRGDALRPTMETVSCGTK